MGMAWKEKYKYTRRRKRKGKSFNPSHEDVNIAVREYLNKGGQIHQIEVDERMPDHLFKDGSLAFEDEFFLDQ